MQTITTSMMYVGIIDVPECGVRDQRGDLEPLISEEIFFKAQAVLSGKAPIIAPLTAIACGNR